jgi:hypothetical protein
MRGGVLACLSVLQYWILNLGPGDVGRGRGGDGDVLEAGKNKTKTSTYHDSFLAVLGFELWGLTIAS